MLGYQPHTCECSHLTQNDQNLNHPILCSLRYPGPLYNSTSLRSQLLSLDTTTTLEAGSLVVRSQYHLAPFPNYPYFPRQYRQVQYHFSETRRFVNFSEIVWYLSSLHVSIYAPNWYSLSYGGLTSRTVDYTSLSEDGCNRAVSESRPATIESRSLH